MKEKPLKLYIAGPITGVENYNRETFAMVAEAIRKNGDIPVNPIDIAESIAPLDKVANDRETFERVIREELSQLATCDELMLLPGWEVSHGTRRELALALSLQMAIFCAPGKRPTIAGYDFTGC